MQKTLISLDWILGNIMEFLRQNPHLAEQGLEVPAAAFGK